MARVETTVWADNAKNRLNGYTGSSHLRNVPAMIGAPIGGWERGGVHMAKLKIRLESETWIFEEFEQA